jgi:hypothetical protein
MHRPGCTPARVLRFKINLKVSDDILPAGFEFGDINPPGFEFCEIALIGPRSEWESEVGPFWLGDLDAVGAFSKFIYIWGWIEYNDVFPNTKRHRTEFCFEVLVSGPANRRENISFRHYIFFNNAESDCWYQPKPREIPPPKGPTG